jgi:hypothetical protein
MASVRRQTRPSQRIVKESWVEVSERGADRPVVTLSDDVVALRGNFDSEEALDLGLDGAPT